MRIEILQAGTGDSIWISHNKKNVVIDGGKLASAIKDRYAQMPQDESIDLLVVTHIDSDHIAGIIALVEQMKKRGELDRLKQVWFNFPMKEETYEYSVSEGNILSSCLCKIENMCWNNNTSSLIGKTVAIGDIKLHVLAPDYDVANEYKPKEPEELGVENADWNVDLKTLIENVDDDDLDDEGPNSQSIVMIVECGGKSILLPGDCTPVELYDALHSYNSTNSGSLKLNLMKLPHHGSLRNITKRIFTEIVCSNFVISTNVNNKYYFPHKETIAKLIRYRNNVDKTINIYINYQESLKILGITDKELAENNIKLYASSEFNI
jgi:Predicted hydrolase (metallo-beta-lactamase superfamily)